MLRGPANSLSICCQSKAMRSLCEDALSPIHVPAEFLGIRLSEKCPFLLRAWGLAFQLFFSAYTINEALQRWHLIGKASDAMRSSETIAATFDTVHGAYFIILVISIVLFNHCKCKELFDIFSMFDQISMNLNCDKIFSHKVKSRMRVFSVCMNSAVLILYILDNFTWSFNSKLHMLQSNIITATWVTSELVFLSMVYLTHQLFAQLNSEIVVNKIKVSFSVNKNTDF